ncbi:MAG TPA: hypothetical protein VFO20_00585 [Propionibacteriaceae bacterium]|nr:hypothetical protein [Propionibacteriaceae bacterium]
MSGARGAKWRRDGSEEELGYAAAVVHDLRAALNLGDRGLDLDPEAAVHQLRDLGVQRDGATEVNQPRTATTPGLDQARQ